MSLTCSNVRKTLSVIQGLITGCIIKKVFVTSIIITWLKGTGKFGNVILKKFLNKKTEQVFLEFRTRPTVQ